MEDAKTIEQRCAAEWERSPRIREEFMTLEAYTAFEKASAAGRVRIYSGTVRDLRG